MTGIVSLVVFEIEACKALLDFLVLSQPKLYLQFRYIEKTQKKTRKCIFLRNLVSRISPFTLQTSDGTCVRCKTRIADSSQELGSVIGAR
jgi:hypothetical protein